MVSKAESEAQEEKAARRYAPPTWATSSSRMAMLTSGFDPTIKPCSQQTNTTELN